MSLPFRGIGRGPPSILTSFGTPTFIVKRRRGRQFATPIIPTPMSTFKRRRILAGPVRARIARSRRAALGRRRRSIARRSLVRNIRFGGFLGKEIKFLDLTLADQAVPATTGWTGTELDPAVNCLNAMVVGNTQSTRIGRRIEMVSIFITGTIKVPAQTTLSAAPLVARMLLALTLDMQSNGAQIQGETVFINPVGDAEVNANPIRNLEFTKRARVLARKMMTVPQRPLVSNQTAGTITVGEVTIPFSFFVKLHGMVVNYSSSTPDIADIVDNSLHLIGNGTSTTGTPVVSYNSRLRYTG